MKSAGDFTWLDQCVEFDMVTGRTSPAYDEKSWDMYLQRLYFCTNEEATQVH